MHTQTYSILLIICFQPCSLSLSPETGIWHRYVWQPFADILTFFLKVQRERSVYFYLPPGFEGYYEFGYYSFP